LWYRRPLAWLVRPCGDADGRSGSAPATSDRGGRVSVRAEEFVVFRRRVGRRAAGPAPCCMVRGVCMGDSRRKWVVLRWVIVVLVGIPAGLFLVAAFLLRNEGRPVVEQSTTYLSSDQQWQATLERVDNGMGFGPGVWYYEVHVHRPGYPIGMHGDRDPSLVFYLDSEGVPPPHVLWVAPRHLVIRYWTGAHEPGKKMDLIAGISISYKRLDDPH
jgi:hypothetical protein